MHWWCPRHGFGGWGLKSDTGSGLFPLALLPLFPFADSRPQFSVRTYACNQNGVTIGGAQCTVIQMQVMANTKTSEDSLKEGVNEKKV
jgi:hypothetical protein